MAVETDQSGDMGAHSRDYSRFIGLFKFGTVAAALVALTVVILIAN